MTKKTKVKQAATAVPVPQNREEVAKYIADIGTAQRELQRIEADMGDAVAALKAQFEAQAEPFRDAITARQNGVHIWCEANRKAITNEGKVKSHSFSTGEINWRNRPPSVALKGVEAILAALRKAKLGKFIRTKEEVNKEAILADPASVKDIKGITIEQGEDFIITPFETELAPA